MTRSNGFATIILPIYVRRLMIVTLAPRSRCSVRDGTANHFDGKSQFTMGCRPHTSSSVQSVERIRLLLTFLTNFNAATAVVVGTGFEMSSTSSPDVNAKGQPHVVHSGGPEGCVGGCDAADSQHISYDPREVTCAHCLGNEQFPMWALQAFQRLSWAEAVQALGAMGENDWQRRSDLADAVVMGLNASELLKEHWYD